MSTIHLVGGEKGGVGKSVMARYLAQLFIDRGFRFAALDADTSHGALMRYYADYCHSVDLESFESADQIVDRAIGSERRVLVDLPAQSSRHLRRWLDAGDVLGFTREMGVKLVYWHVSDGGFDSAHQLETATEALGDEVHMVVVRNHGRSPSFDQLDESTALGKLLASGGRVVDLPALDAATMYSIDRHGMSFWAASNNAEGEFALPPMGRRRVSRWLSESAGALRGVEDWL